MKRTILRYSAIAMATAGLAVGVAAASSASIDTTGPNSNNSVKDTVSNNLNVRNHNNVSVRNDNDQNASSGRAEVRGNTTGGSATSGDATNDNTVSTDLTISNGNGACGCLSGLLGGADNTGDIHLTGPNSRNTIEFKSTNNVNVSNDNHVNVSNDNDQRATSGSAEVEHNTTGGDATSGAASNTSSTSTSVSISN